MNATNGQSQAVNGGFGVDPRASEFGRRLRSFQQPISKECAGCSVIFVGPPSQRFHSQQCRRKYNSRKRTTAKRLEREQEYLILRQIGVTTVLKDVSTGDVYLRLKMRPGEPVTEG